ncbi:type IV secretion protein Rhs [Rouxiella sp. Mn2063]|uniref:type IV secretion protein Rhs n=1 Tax=Rouxiella sp. Mn2063 TaxID=3395262 RepID=UPI003BE1FD12
MLVQETKDGSLRLMTPGEISMAQEIYKGAIEYYKVWVHKGSYLPFGLQNKKQAMTPSGEIYFRDDYTPDFSSAAIRLKHIFIHELAHVWQRQQGMNVKTIGLFSWAADYDYKLENRSLSSYGMEQQAQIIADYFLLTQPNGRASWDDLSFCKNGANFSDAELLKKYKKMLAVL